MKKKLTITQKMINFVYNNGPSTWTEIQMYILGLHGYKGTAQEMYKSSLRGYGSLGVWKCAKRSARGRNYYISNRDIHTNDVSKRYVVVDAYTGQTMWNKKILANPKLAWK